MRRTTKMKAAIRRRVSGEWRRLRSSRGFTLVEVILGSIIIAGFVATTVYTAGEIASAKRNALAIRDANTWANLQSAFAATGVRAPSDNGDVWYVDGLPGFTYEKLYGSSVLTVDSTAVDSTDDADSSKMGKSVVVRPFTLDLSAVAQRDNVQTLGLSLMDRASYNEDVPSGADPSATDENPADLEKPDSIYGFSTDIAVAYYKDSGYTVSTSSNVTISALTNIPWTQGTSGVAFYILVGASSGEIGSASCTVEGISIAGTTSHSFSDYVYAFPVTLADLADLTSSTITARTVATKDGDDTVKSYGVETISVDRASLSVTQYRADSVTGLNIDSTIAATYGSKSYVTLADAAGVPFNGYSSIALCAESVAVYDPNDEATTAIEQAILSYVSLYNYIDSYRYIDDSDPDLGRSAYGTTMGPGNLGSGYTGVSSFTPYVTYFNPNDTTGYRYIWTVTSYSDRTGYTAPSYSALIEPVYESAHRFELIPEATQLEDIVYDPAAGSYTSSQTVSMLPGGENILSDTDVDDEVYAIYYTEDGTTPTTDSDSISSTGTVTVDESETLTAFAAGLSPYYPLFVNDSDVDSAAYEIDSESVKERTTVMKVKRIEDTLNGYIQGTIQVLEDDSFTLNGSSTIGMKLYTRYEPTITANASTHVYNSEPDSYDTGVASVVGANYTIPSSNPTNGTISSTDGNSSATVIINNVPSEYTMILIGDNSSTMVAAEDSQATYSNGTIQLKGGSGTDIKKNVSTISSLYLNQDTNCTSLELEPGVYNYGIKLTGGAVLKLEPGDYHFYSLAMESGTQILPLGDDVNMFIYQPGVTLEGSATPTEWEDGKIICRSTVDDSAVEVTEDTDFTQVYVNLSGGCIIGTRDYPVTMHLTSYTVEATYIYVTVTPNGIVSDDVIPYFTSNYDSWMIESSRRDDGYYHFYSWVTAQTMSFAITSASTSGSTTINGQFYGTIYSNAQVHLNTCAVIGRIESYSIDTNSNTYLFIKEWK